MPRLSFFATKAIQKSPELEFPAYLDHVRQRDKAGQEPRCVDRVITIASTSVLEAE